MLNFGGVVFLNLPANCGTFCLRIFSDGACWINGKQTYHVTEWTYNFFTTTMGSMRLSKHTRDHLGCWSVKIPSISQSYYWIHSGVPSGRLKYCWWKKSGDHQLIGSLSYHYSHGLNIFIHPRRWSPDFWTINSSNGISPFSIGSIHLQSKGQFSSQLC